MFFKNIIKLMSCGVVSGFLLNFLNKCRCGRGEEGGCMVIKDIGNINLFLLVFVWVFYNGFM